MATESGKLATWIDETIAPLVASRLEHAASSSVYPDVSMQSQNSPHKIVALHVSSLMSAVQLNSGAVYWWGIPPFSHRKKLIEKIKQDRSKGSASSATKSKSSSASKEPEIVQGSLVCMKSSPVYQAGAIAFTTAGGVPRIGQLVTAAWKMTDQATFKVLTSAEIQARAGLASCQKLAAQQQASQNNGNVNSSDQSSSSKSSSFASAAAAAAALEASRIEMPPPPSPASSTSSEPSSYNPPLPKRVKTKSSSSTGSAGSSIYSAGFSSANNNNVVNLQHEADHSSASERVESWHLKDVVFLEDAKNMPLGKVIKVDGNYVAVRFSSPSSPSPSTASSSVSPSAGSSSTSPEVIDNSFQDCRLLRKDELVLVNSGGQNGSFPSGKTSCGAQQALPPYSLTSRAYDCFQRYPKKVHLPEHVHLISTTLTNQGLVAIAKVSSSKLSYVTINLISGKVEQDAKMLIDSANVVNSAKSSLIRLYSSGETDDTTVVLCRDGNGTLYPLATDCTETLVREPVSLNLGPLANISLGVFSLPPPTAESSSVGSSSSSKAKTHATIMGFAFEPQRLMSAILRGDLTQIRDLLTMVERNPAMYSSMLTELCDGNHNIIHVAVSMCFQTLNNPSPSDSSAVSWANGSFKFKIYSFFSTFL